MSTTTSPNAVDISRGLPVRIDESRKGVPLSRLAVFPKLSPVVRFRPIP